MCSKKKKKKKVKILSEGSGYNSAKFCGENFPLYGRRPGCRVSKLNVVVQGDSSFFAKWSDILLMLLVCVALGTIPPLCKSTAITNTYLWGVSVDTTTVQAAH